MKIRKMPLYLLITPIIIDFILCSGDGDFVRLVKYLKAHFKKTVVIAPSKRFSTNLWKAASRAIDLEDLRNDIGIKK